MPAVKCSPRGLAPRPFPLPWRVRADPVGKPGVPVWVTQGVPMAELRGERWRLLSPRLVGEAWPESGRGRRSVWLMRWNPSPCSP